MEIKITEEMIDEAISRVDSKLAQGTQKEKVYSNSNNVDQYYINNITGELGEIVFNKAVIENDYELGVDSHQFGTFLNSDLCDFYTSKTAKTVDVKTTSKSNMSNLMVSEDIANWRPIDFYVLVQLLPSSELAYTLESIYEINKAVILGSKSYGSIQTSGKLRQIHGRGVYCISPKLLTPINYLFEHHFNKKSIKRPSRYYSNGTIDFEIASIESGAVIKNKSNINIDKMAERFRAIDNNTGTQNFKVMVLLVSNKIISFSMHNDRLNIALLLKGLLKAEFQARSRKLTLIIPSYIENYIDEVDKSKVIDVIENLKCNVEYVWSHNKTY